MHSLPPAPHPTFNYVEMNQQNHAVLLKNKSISFWTILTKQPQICNINQHAVFSIRKLRIYVAMNQQNENQFWDFLGLIAPNLKH